MDRSFYLYLIFTSMIIIASSRFKTRDVCVSIWRVKDVFSYDTDQVGLESIVANDNDPPDYRIIIPSDKRHDANNIISVTLTNDEGKYRDCSLMEKFDDPTAKIVSGAKVMIMKAIENCPTEDFVCMEVQYDPDKKTSSEIKEEQDYGDDDGEEPEDDQSPIVVDKGKK